MIAKLLQIDETELVTLWLADKFTAAIAKEHAEKKFEKYCPIQDRISDRILTKQ